MRLRLDLVLGTALFLVAAPALADDYCATKRLDILLTNDDGFDSVGIKAMRSALIAAGHDVVLVGPATNSSGSSAAVTFAAVPVNSPEPNVYAVTGTPATTVLLGVTGVLGGVRPDLIVSGINDGANIGPATPISGTVGATIAAITQFTPGIPAVAISTDKIDQAAPAGSPVNLAHFEAVAEFTARLVGQLVASSCGSRKPLLPERTALNVNYPPLPPNEAKGPTVAVQGRTPYFSIGYAQVAPGIYAPQFALTGETDPNPRSDTRLFEDGFVTVVPVDGDYTSPKPVQDQVMKALCDLRVDPAPRPRPSRQR